MDKCLPCLLENCILCYERYTICTQCKVGYYLVDS